MTESENAIAFLKQHAKKCQEIDSFVLRGSNAYGAEQIQNWSDIDATMVVKDVSANTMGILRGVCTAFRKSFPEVQLSLTVIEKQDTPYTNPWHHHGVKPIAYNFELAQHFGRKIPFFLSEDAVRLSSVYRYYEILHDFRRACVENSRFTGKMVTRGFHRLALLLRTQVEILRPDLVKKTGKVHARKYVSLLHPTKHVRRFFHTHDLVRKNWEQIRQDDACLQKYGDYLTDTFGTVHKTFLPKLITLGKGACV